LLAAAIAGWLIAGIAVRPLQRLIQFAAGLRPDNLQEPIDIGGSRASELTDLQAELDRMRQRLETGYEAQERFVANVSHEIKTPIATVLTEAQTLPKGLAVPGDVRQFIESTQDEMRRLGRLVESFLMLTRVRHGKPLESTARTVGVNDVVMDSIQHCWKTAEQHSVHLLPELALEGDRELKVRGDPDLLRTMVDNLIRNAIRFSPKDQPIPIIVRHDGDHVSVCVRDKGPGFRRNWSTRSSTASHKPRARRSSAAAAAWGWRSHKASPSCTAGESASPISTAAVRVLRHAPPPPRPATHESDTRPELVEIHPQLFIVQFARGMMVCTAKVVGGQCGCPATPGE
jgi:nitrogen fixation/metabolism regulation signal transduction histidine kinase